MAGTELSILLAKASTLILKFADTLLSPTMVAAGKARFGVKSSSASRT